MISTISSAFSLSLYSPTDMRVLQDMFEVSLELSGPTDDLGQLTTRTAAIDHSTIEQVWQEHLLLRVPSSRCPEGKATAPDLLAVFLPATRSMFALAAWIGSTLADHPWLEGPRVERAPLCMHNDIGEVFPVRTTLLTHVGVARTAVQRGPHRVAVVLHTERIAIDDLADVKRCARRPWSTYDALERAL